MRKLFFLLSFLVLVLLIGCTDQQEIKEQVNASEFDYWQPVDFDAREIKFLEDGTKYIVHPTKIKSGGPPKDGIPSIDNPIYVSMQEADEWIEDNELVMTIDYKGVKRVYPFQILVWHEIVNDFIADDPILITYCPLCGTGIAYERKIDGKAVEFGTSGKLFNSNLVMYDRKTDSYWSQIDGVAIIGELTGMELKELSVDTMTWGEWKSVYNEAEVLSQETGFTRQYGRDPYGGYYENDFVLFDVENEDKRFKIQAKTVIFGIEVDGIHKAYRESDIIGSIEIEDQIGSRKITITRDEAGVVKIFDIDSGEEIVKERGFWFSWYAFHPETLVYGFN